MNKVKYRLTLDLQKPGIQHTIYAKKMDSASRDVIFTLRDGGKPYVITDDVKAYMYALAGEAEIFTECEVNKNSITASLTTNMLTEDSAILELRLTDGTDKILAAGQIKVISEDIIYSENAMVATNEFTALLEAISRANSARIVDVAVIGQTLVITYADGVTVECEVETVQGVPGKDGLSPYLYALEQGYNNPEADFAARYIATFGDPVVMVKAEEWEFTLDDGSIVIKKVLVLE